MRGPSSDGLPVIGVEVDEAHGRDDWLVHLSITWDGLPDVHAASDFASHIHEIANEHFAQLRRPPPEASLDL